jgi:hypothetical protein
MHVDFLAKADREINGILFEAALSLAAIQQTLDPLAKLDITNFIFFDSGNVTLNG